MHIHILGSAHVDRKVNGFENGDHMPTCIITNRMDPVTAQELKTNSKTAQTGRREAVNGHIWLPRADLSESVYHGVKLNTGIYRKPLTGPFPLSLQCFLLRDTPPVGPRFPL